MLRVLLDYISIQAAVLYCPSSPGNIPGRLGFAGLIIADCVFKNQEYY